MLTHYYAYDDSDIYEQEFCLFNFSRALTRMGTSFEGLEDFERALEYYSKSLEEYNDPVVVEKQAKVTHDSSTHNIQVFLQYTTVSST